jgi:ribosome-binding factor A
MAAVPNHRRLRAGSIPAADAGSALSAPSQRMLRVGELVRHKLADMLSRGDIHDDILQSTVITIPEVRMSTDLKLATCYVMPLGGRDIKPVLAALERNKRFIRGEIAHTINLKFSPDVRFREDESFGEATRIDQLLDSPKVRQDLVKPVAPDTTKSDENKS